RATYRRVKLIGALLPQFEDGLAEPHPATRSDRNATGKSLRAQVGTVRGSEILYVPLAVVVHHHGMLRGDVLVRERDGHVVAAAHGDGLRVQWDGPVACRPVPHHHAMGGAERGARSMARRPPALCLLLRPDAEQPGTHRRGDREDEKPEHGEKSQL